MSGDVAPPDRPSRAAGPGGPRPARLRLVLYCGKCLKRRGNGKALRRILKGGVKARVAEVGGRKVRVAETGCLGLCPKGALVVASAATLARGEALVLRDEAEAAAALPLLLPDADQEDDR